MHICPTLGLLLYLWFQWWRQRGRCRLQSSCSSLSRYRTSHRGGATQRSWSRSNRKTARTGIGCLLGCSRSPPAGIGHWDSSHGSRKHAKTGSGSAWGTWSLLWSLGDRELQKRGRTNCQTLNKTSTNTYTDLNMFLPFWPSSPVWWRDEEGRCQESRKYQLRYLRYTSYPPKTKINYHYSMINMSVQ